MLESFPNLADTSKLTGDDFSRFSMSYAEILQKHLPTAKDVVFAFSAGQVENILPAHLSASELLPLFTKVKEGDAAFGAYSDCLMLPFSIQDRERIVAIISGADPLFIQKASEDWLLEIKETAEREFLLIKQARIDNQTGLLNIANLYSLLDRYGTKENLGLILVELIPKRASFQYIVRYAQKYATLLVEFIPTGSLLHCLGQSTFALVLPQNFAGKRSEIERALVNYLKKEGCHRVHVGSSFSNVRSKGDDQSSSSRKLLDEAWTALQHATRRGPFSFCDFGQLAHPENHPLAPPDRNIVRRLSRLWSSSNNFCLVQFSSDNDTSCSASSVVTSLIQQKTVLSDGADVFVYLDGVNAGDALQWAQEIISRSVNSQENIHISAGVSSYPYCGFKKSELVMNCRKALLHAAFYGKSSAAVFDAVSLNISGDIYFSDGDLARSVKEYQRGLRCDDRDVNLHNSLGVALAMMNKLSSALQSFKRGLALDRKNFMALYNLGLGEQARNRKTEALAYLEKALKYSAQEEGGTELVHDLTLQLGILSCELGKYSAALGYLVPWLSDNKQSPRAGRVHYYLGEAYHALKDNRNAMGALQRALRFNEMDDRAMSLLGRIYLDEGEGDQIALSLCRKSVELEPSNLRYMLYLGQVLLQCGLFPEARENLYRCLKNRKYKTEAQLLLGKSYADDGQSRRAKTWFAKVIAEKNIRREFKVTAEQELKKMKSKNLI
ncbi:tetratricopeptide repeat protein [Desulfopila sp. IMCC35006]|uniref:tetratricopeptide repeat protein n=1 Tax=Desulfopila sp. IMCC35006 TaxID=2569542 RepID=UPI0010ACFF95|nr:tetratricopeptide repeat protein [Desulfopila sp. IMCC35006]TKB23205.1 tetratricopeptide repeat protein [Desulfopila sp. IMCC35006]